MTVTTCLLCLAIAGHFFAYATPNPQARDANQSTQHKPRDSRRSPVAPYAAPEAPGLAQRPPVAIQEWAPAARNTEEGRC